MEGGGNASKRSGGGGAVAGSDVSLVTQHVFFGKSRDVTQSHSI